MYKMLTNNQIGVFKKTLLTIIALLSLLFSLYGQEKGELKLNIFPNDSYVRLKGEVFKVLEKNKLVLDTGKYTIEIWSPKMKVLTDTIEIKSNEMLKYYKGLKKTSSAYDLYRKKIRKYYSKKFIDIGLGAAVIGANAGLTALVFNPKKKSEIEMHRRNAIRAKMIYEDAVLSEAMAEAKSNYEFHKNEYNKKKESYNTRLKVGIPSLVVAYGLGSYYILKKLKKKRIKPKYEEKNPLLNLEVTPSIGYDGDKMLFNTVIKF